MRGRENIENTAGRAAPTLYTVPPTHFTVLPSGDLPSYRVAIYRLAD